MTKHVGDDPTHSTGEPGASEESPRSGGALDRHRPEDGVALLRLGRTRSAEVSARLRDLAPEAVVATLQTVRPEKRAELLECVEQLDAVVPLLPEAEFATTVVAAGVADAGWLLAHATPRQRVAAIDFDCWQGEKFSPHRARDWVDALIEAGDPTLVAAFAELDAELWVLILKSMARFTVPGMTYVDEDDAADAEEAGITLDGQVFFSCDDGADEERVRRILETAQVEAPDQYWRLVYGALLENVDDCRELAVRWYRGRLSDLGFPAREQALEVYRPIRVDVESLRRVEGPPSEAGALVLGGPFEGTGLGRALRELPPSLAEEVVGALLSLANALAVADALPLAEPSSVEKSLRKALHGVSRGLEEMARAAGRPARIVLGFMPPRDLFRVGVQVDPELRPERPVPAHPGAEDEDWDVVQEMISAFDQSLGPESRPR